MLEVYAITHRTADYGEKFVVRRNVITRDGQLLIALVPTAVVDSLEEARAACPRGLIRSDRWPGDDPVIVETWL